MGKLNSFTFMTLDGYYSGPGGDISWAKQEHKEENDFASDNVGSGGGNTLLFGKTTYEMMASWWPSEMAIKTNPGVANGMNAAEKIVFSRTLKKAEWHNTSIIHDDIEGEMARLKNTTDKSFTLLGSGDILTPFAAKGLIDEYQFMIYPYVLGKGKRIFTDITHALNLRLKSSRAFKSGTMLLVYEPA